MREFEAGKGPVFGLAFAPDGKSLVVGAGREAKIWPAAGGAGPVFLGPRSPSNVGAVGWSPDGKAVVVVNGNRIYQYEADGTPRPWPDGWDGNLGRNQQTHSLVSSKDGRSVLLTRDDA